MSSNGAGEEIGDKQPVELAGWPDIRKGMQDKTDTRAWLLKCAGRSVSSELEAVLPR
ncbi:MAG: hypothetical protein RLY31_1386 [Bacteroidota bacterium]|jgi:hypothetical protein